MKWFKRWRKIGYRKLWHLHFGGYHEGDKGCRREYDFMLEVTSGWRNAYQTERELRVEAEKMLTDAGIEPPTDRRIRLIKEKYDLG
jgi:hypothetical protein